MRHQNKALRRAATSLADSFRKAGIAIIPRRAPIAVRLPAGTVAAMQAGQPAYLCSIMAARGHVPFKYRVGRGNPSTNITHRAPSAQRTQGRS